MIEFTESEIDSLRGIVSEWINEGFTTPPYAPYDIRRPADA
jgi:hypothetical protein